MDEFEIKYWAGENNFLDPKPKRERSIKKRLFIVFSFVFLLAIIPILVYSLSEFNPRKEQKVIIVQKEVTEKKSDRTKPIQPNPTPQTSQVEVINNDSYWKISKRACGTGKYYLSVRDQNLGKPLYKGESVSVSCTL